MFRQVSHGALVGLFMFRCFLPFSNCSMTHWRAFDYVCCHCSASYALVTMPFVFGSLAGCDRVLCLSPYLKVRIMFVASKCLLVFDLVQGIPIEMLECTLD